MFKTKEKRIEYSDSTCGMNVDYASSNEKVLQDITNMYAKFSLTQK
jgi:hypothetical protein